MIRSVVGAFILAEAGVTVAIVSAVGATVVAGLSAATTLYQIRRSGLASDRAAAATHVAAKAEADAKRVEVAQDVLVETIQRQREDIERLSGEVASLRAEVDQVRSQRSECHAENARLRQELARLRRQP